MMSGKVGEQGRDTGKTDVDEVVGDVLQDIERALSPAPPRAVEPSIPAPPDSEDHLGALAAQLMAEQNEERRRLQTVPPFVATVALDDAWANEDDALTTEWRRETPVPPAPESSRTLYVEEEGRELTHRDTVSLEDDVTPRPAAVSVSRLEAPGRRPIPLPLVAVALISIGAAIVSYRLGPHSAAAVGPSRIATGDPVAAVPVAAAPPATTEYGKPVQTQRLLVTLTPADARLAVRAMGEPEGEPSAGPWPRAYDLAPAVYELVAFHDGLSVVSRLEVEPGLDPPPLTLHLPVAK